MNLILWIVVGFLVPSIIFAGLLVKGVFVLAKVLLVVFAVLFLVFLAFGLIAC